MALAFREKEWHGKKGTWLGIIYDNNNKTQITGSVTWNDLRVMHLIYKIRIKIIVPLSSQD